MYRASYFLRLYNLCLRASNLASKFFLIVFLARYLAPHEVGLYGLLVATITYSIFPLGLEFYTYNARELIASDKSKWGWLIKNQLLLYIRTYLIFLPLFLIIFISNLLPWRMAPWFFLLLIFEHVNQEMMRLLIAMSKQVSATISLLIRQGLWIIPALLCIYIFPEKRNLEFILSAWLISSVCAASFSALIIYFMPISGWTLPVDWAIIKKGIRTSSILLTANLSINFIWIADKYWLEYLQGSEILGAYIFFLALASSFLSLLEASVFSFIYPSMIRAAADNNIKLLRRQLIIMAKQTVLLYLLFSTTAILSIEIILDAIGKHIYINHIKLFYFSLAAIAIYALSSTLNYVLYAQKKDRETAKINISGAIFFIISTGFFSLFDTYISIPSGICCAFSVILLLKANAVTNFFKHNKRHNTQHAQPAELRKARYDI